MQNRKRIFTLTISALVLLGFMATSLIGYFVARDSTSDQLQKQMLPLTSDNIYSEIQRDLLQPLLISSYTNGLRVRTSSDDQNRSIVCAVCSLACS